MMTIWVMGYARRSTRPGAVTAQLQGPSTPMGSLSTKPRSSWWCRGTTSPDRPSRIGRAAGLSLPKAQESETAFIFRCPDRLIRHTMPASPLRDTCLMLVSCLAYFSTVKVEATCSSETSVNFQHITCRYIPEDRTLRKYCYENLKSYLDNNISVRRHTSSIHVSASQPSTAPFVHHIMICFPGLSFCEVFVTFHPEFVLVEPCLLQ
jgi:hypothetical protein